MQPVKVYRHRKQCQYAKCQKIFYVSNTNKKYCSWECAGLARGDTRHDMQPNDPTPEQIADMCRRIRSGEIVVHSSQERDGAPRLRLRPNWFFRKG